MKKMFLFFSLRCTLFLISAPILCMHSPFEFQKKLLLCIGLPGSGKTTVCHRVAQRYPELITHQSVGDLLRAEATNSTERGKIIRSLMGQGSLVPFETTLEIIGDFLSQNTKPVILLDGYQGTKEYIAPFDELIANRNITLVKVISFEVTTMTALERCRFRMRADDTPAALQNRMEIRLKNLVAIKDWYSAQELLVLVDANRPLEDVIKQMENIVD